MTPVTPAWPAPPGQVTRHHAAGGAHGTACYSPCESWRYGLARVWDAAAPRVLRVMLNPSTATEARNDPTLARVQARARALGHGGFGVVNLFALRATDPADLRGAPDPVGPANDAAILAALPWAGQVICAWGAHGAHADRGAQVAARLRDAGVALWHLGLTRGGQPRHPLYLPLSLPPQPWD